MKPAEIQAVAKGFQFMERQLSARVEETHISWVLLTPRHAFKIKKPVTFSFLDFSTLSRREKACEKEVVLNRRLTTIYLSVLPVKFNDGLWSFGGYEGITVDHAVVMRRMRTNKRMDLLLHKDQVSGKQVSHLAGVIADFHARAKVVSAPFVPHLAHSLFNDVRTIKDFLIRNVGPDAGRIISAAITWSNSFLKRHASRFRQRALSGYRRDLHGDLHCANIFLYKQPVIFDCVEFNDSFRHVDVLDEIAFLVMDLESFDNGQLAETLLNSYLASVPYLETAEDFKIFSYYKCYRANVRMKVHAIMAGREGNPAKRNEHIERMTRYLSLIEQYIKPQSISKADEELSSSDLTNII